MLAQYKRTLTATYLTSLSDFKDLLRHVYYAVELEVPLTGSSHKPVGDPRAHSKNCFDYLR